VAVVDLPSGRTVARPAVGAGPSGLAVTPDGRHVWATSGVSRGSSASSYAVSVIDTATARVTDRVPVPGVVRGLGPIAFSPDGARAYVGAPQDGLVAAVDVATGSIVGTASVGRTGDYGERGGVAVSPDGRRLYIADGGIAVLDASSMRVTEHWNVRAGAVSISPDGRRLIADNVQVDTRDGSVVATMSGACVASTVLPDGTRAYCVDPGGSVSVVAVV